MAVNVKKVVLWRTEVSNHPGELARVLEPLARAGTNLRVAMGYGAAPGRAVIELFPVTGKKSIGAAQNAGLSPSSIACLLAEGDDRPALGRDMARAIADAGVNISFLVAETVGRKFSAVFGFESAQDAAKAQRAINSAAKKKGRR